MENEACTPDPDDSFERYVEKRRWNRYACVTKAVMSSEFIVSWPAMLLNISRGGVGLQLQDRLESGTPLMLALFNPQTGQTLPERIAHVTHAAEHDGNWIVGAQFDTELTDDELEQIREDEQAV